MIIVFVAWCINTVEMYYCDFGFEDNYRCEAIHGIGLFIPVLSVITAWVGSDQK